MLNDKKSNIKKRNWSAIIYEDSAPEDWIEILRLKGLPFAISPYHDKDINPDGTPKKPHHHIIICWDAPTTFSNVKALICDELHQPMPIPLESVRGMYRYFTHMDNPEKYQYNERDIKLYNGFDVNDVVNSFEVFQSIKTIQGLIVEHDILEYCDLMDFLLQSDYMDLWNVASSHTLFFNTYITSRRHSLEKKQRV